MSNNFLAPIRDREFRGDLGRPERKTPNAGWAQWLDEVSAKAAGYFNGWDVRTSKVTSAKAVIPTVGALIRFLDTEGNDVGAMQYDSPPHT